MNKTETVNNAKAAAGKAAGVFYSAKSWVGQQFQKPVVVLVTGMALGAVATIGAEKGMQSYRGHKYGGMRGNRAAN